MDDSAPRLHARAASPLSEDAFHLYHDLPRRFTLGEVLELAEGRRIPVSRTVAFLLGYHAQGLLHSEGAWFVKHGPAG